jgi:hypothetical protein
MIDTKQSFRKGKVIVEVHVEGSNSTDNPGDVITRKPTEYKSINAAKRANRLTKYRTVPVKAGAK